MQQALEACERLVADANPVMIHVIKSKTNIRITQIIYLNQLIRYIKQRKEKINHRDGSKSYWRSRCGELECK